VKLAVFWLFLILACCKLVWFATIAIAQFEYKLTDRLFLKSLKCVVQATNNEQNSRKVQGTSSEHSLEFLLQHTIQSSWEAIVLVKKGSIS